MPRSPGRVSRAIEIIANVCIIVVALLGSVVLVKQIASPGGPQWPSVGTTGRPAPGARPAPVRGAHIELAGVDWSQRDKTIVLILSTSCHFCSDSAPFYRRMAGEARRRGRTGLVAVFPQGADEARRFLSQAKLQIDTVVQALPSSIGIRGTPTLLLVNRQGVVRDTWVGRLSVQQEAEVFERLQAAM